MWHMVSQRDACHNLMLIKWQMLLPRWQMKWLPKGGFTEQLADVTAMVADGLTTIKNASWTMLRTTVDL